MIVGGGFRLRCSAAFDQSVDAFPCFFHLYELLQSSCNCVKVRAGMVEFVRIRLVVAALLLIAGAPYAFAQDNNATAALTKASKILEKGDALKAIDVINETLKSGSLTADLAAKAMMMRAQAQEKLGKYAYALADYNSALWMQDLSASDKSEAEKGRDRIMAKLGVNSAAAKPSDGGAPPAQEPPKQRAASTGSSGSSKSWDTEVQRSSEQRTGGIGSIFSDVFGSSSAAGTERQPAKPNEPPRAQPVRAGAAPAQPAKAAPLAPAPVKVAASQPEQSILIASSTPSGDFAIQFAALLSEDSAISEVERVAKRYGELLGGRRPSIKVRETSDGGTLYKIVAEPYERGEGVATCELLKTKGVSCMLISR
jgi:hypothetical protein